MFNFITQQQAEFILRLFLACICGIAIGFERKNRAKEAGIRTHCIVTCASALMMIISKYGFSDLPYQSDGARIAAQVVSGIGFLGAGIIFVQRQTVKGLTTAAGIWATSGIGLALGAGMYLIGIAATLLILITQYILHSNLKIFQTPSHKLLSVYNVTEKSFQKNATDKLKEMGIDVTDVRIKNNGETLDYFLNLEVRTSVSEEELIHIFPYLCSIKSGEQ